LPLPEDLPAGEHTIIVRVPPDDETMSAFLLKNGALGNAKNQTLRAFRKEEMEGILAKMK